jgi:hypothetical protein
VKTRCPAGVSFAALALSAVIAAPAAPEPRCGVIKKLDCRPVEDESSIKVTAVDQAGEPADGLWIDALTTDFGREQSAQVDQTGHAKLWVGRTRSYEVQAYGRSYAGQLRLRGVRVPLGCELQVRIVMCRNERRSPTIVVE